MAGCFYKMKGTTADAPDASRLASLLMDSVQANAVAAAFPQCIRDFPGLDGSYWPGILVAIVAVTSR
jgi:hypothetical protein